MNFKLHIDFAKLCLYWNNPMKKGGLSEMLFEQVTVHLLRLRFWNITHNIVYIQTCVNKSRDYDQDTSNPNDPASQFAEAT